MKILEGVSGFLIEPGNNKAFAGKLKEAVGMDRESYLSLSKSAYDFGIKKYAAEGAIDRFLELISK